MNLTEKAAYLKGLAEGLSLGSDTKEAKVLGAVIDLLDDMALTIADIDDEVAEINGRIDEIDEDLADVEDEIFGEEDYDDEDEFYEIECPGCSETVCVDADVLEDGNVVCPNCGQEIEIEVECDCDECDENN